MSAKIKVQAQYFENYSDTNTPHWKPKGGQEFIFPVSSDWVMYVEKEEMIESIDQMLANYSNEHCKYEYREHDVSFSDPIVLEGLQEIRAEIFG